jgi:hypothetical protein
VLFEASFSKRIVDVSEEDDVLVFENVTPSMVTLSEPLKINIAKPDTFAEIVLLFPSLDLIKKFDHEPSFKTQPASVKSRSIEMVMLAPVCGA